MNERLLSFQKNLWREWGEDEVATSSTPLLQERNKKRSLIYDPEAGKSNRKLLVPKDDDQEYSEGDGVGDSDTSDCATELDNEIGKKAMRKLSLRVLPIIAFVYSVASIEKSNISLAADGIMRDLHMNAGQFGFTTSLYFVPYSFLQLPVVLLAKMIGPKYGLATMAFLFGVASMFTALSKNSSTFLILRIILGITECGVVPFTSYVTSIFYSHDTIGVANAEVSIWLGLINVALGPLAALFLVIGERSPLIADWQGLLLLDGVPALIAAVLVLILLPSSPVKCCDFLDSKQYTWFMRKIQETQKERERRSIELSKSDGESFRGILKLFFDFRILITMILTLFFVTALYGASFFFPLIISHGKEEEMVLFSSLSFIPTSISVLISYFFSWLSDRKGQRLVYAAIGGCIIALSLLMTAFLLNASFVPLYCCYIGHQVGVSLYGAMLKNYQADILPNVVSAAGFAIISGFNALGGFFGPLIMGSLKQHTESYTLPLLVLSGLSSVGTSLILLLHFVYHCIRK